MLAEQALRRRAHRIAIEWAKAPADRAGFNCGPHHRLQQNVDVAAPDGGIARVKGVVGEPAPLHSDVPVGASAATVIPTAGIRKLIAIPSEDLRRAP